MESLTIKFENQIFEKYLKKRNLRKYLKIKFLRIYVRMKNKKDGVWLMGGALEGWPCMSCQRQRNGPEGREVLTGTVAAIDCCFVVVVIEVGWETDYTNPRASLRSFCRCFKGNVVGQRDFTIEGPFMENIGALIASCDITLTITFGFNPTFSPRSNLKKKRPSYFPSPC